MDVKRERRAGRERETVSQGVRVEEDVEGKRKGSWRSGIEVDDEGLLRCAFSYGVG